MQNQRPKANNSSSSARPSPRRQAPMPASRSSVNAAGATQKQPRRTAPLKSVKKKPIPVKSTPERKNPIPPRTARRDIENGKQIINRKVMNQSPSRRKTARDDKRISSRKSEIEVRGRQSNKARFSVKRKKSIMRVILGRLLLFLVFFILIFAVGIGLLTLSLHSGSPEKTFGITYYIGSKKQDEADIYKLSQKIAHYNASNDAYIPIDAMREMCDLTVTGDVSVRRYVTRAENYQSVAFVINEDIAYINGVRIRMDSPAVLLNGTLYVPLGFVKNYVSGLVIDTSDNESSVTLTREKITSPDGTTSPAPIMFTLSVPSNQTPLLESDYS